MEEKQLMPAQVLHILLSSYTVDSRVTNETQSLVKDGFDVSVYCLRAKTLPNCEDRGGVKLERFGIGASKSILFLTAYLMILFSALKKRFDVVHAHDVTALPIAFTIAKLKRIPLIYDSHELWSQSHHQLNSKILIGAVCFVEKFIASRAQVVVTVSDSIAEYLQTHFNNSNVEVVRNIPSYYRDGTFDIFREENNLTDRQLVILYQGQISESRGLNVIIDAAKSIVESVDSVVVFIGGGPAARRVNEICEQSDQLLYYPAVPQAELYKYTRSADIGIHAIENTCLNHYYCLPNKLFEYMCAELAVVIADMPEMRNFVEEFGFGCCFRAGNAEDLARVVIDLASDHSRVAELKQNAKLAAQHNTWDREYSILRDIYNNFVS